MQNESDWDDVRRDWDELVDNWNDMMAEWQPLFDVMLSPLGLLFSLGLIAVCSVLLLGIVITLWRDRQIG